MKKVKKSTPDNSEEKLTYITSVDSNNERICPSCELKTLQGMPGGRDAICSNCGYKDPCCYD